MFDARAIANFFLDRASEDRRPLTVMTLLKVLYFAHAWHLAKFNKALIAQPFEAWRHGPVNRVVYDQLKGQGSKPICKKLISFDMQQSQFAETKYQFDSSLETFLIDVYNYYSQFHAFQLSDLTHEKGSPWDHIWNKAERQSVPGMTIPNELIREWFTESSRRQLTPPS